ncbi:hypothetical protein JYU34_000869 [Plutella xylostella]|uniref:Uncharacterized protein n=1 Tax=Plutella xylostella TaxID=51655 RepID=A0ABQ7R5L5_PLUXY|nr:hypothetical protein JYU34_000869 [Plutella xylostella]
MPTTLRRTARPAPRPPPLSKTPYALCASSRTAPSSPPPPRASPPRRASSSSPYCSAAET